MEIYRSVIWAEVAPSGNRLAAVHLIGSTARAFNYRKSHKRDKTGYWGLLGATLLMCLPLPAITRLLVSKNRIGLKFNHSSMQNPF